MEQGEDNHIHIIPRANQKVKISASEIIKKFKTLKDRQSFCKENSKYSI